MAQYIYRFVLSEEESKRADDWITAHECPRRGKNSGAIGGRTTFQFTSTTLGVIGVVACACGASEAFTDMSDW